MFYRYSCLFLLGVICLFSTCLTAQTAHFNRSAWTQVSEQNIPVSAAERQIIPQKYTTWQLDIELLRVVLAFAPSEADHLLADVEMPVLEMPQPDGSFRQYRVWDFGIFHPDLQTKFPDIRSYCGEAVDHPGVTIFFDVSPRGLHSMTLHDPEGAVFIDPYSTADDQHYLVYFKHDFVRPESERMPCLVGDGTLFDPKLAEPLAEFLPAANCGKRREYRLAMAATGEYTTFHGGTVAAGLAAINTSMTRVNGVFVTEASIKMILIANNDLVVYTNSTTDPYTNNSGTTMLAENQTNLTSVIGDANYDIGHVFSTGGGGVATINSPCSSTLKARGVTGRGSPVGDPFDIDYVAHEIGHQYGARHTFASVSGSCNGNITTTSAYEPGSGSTIMAYAGICSPQNVQSNSDPYFHARSLNQFSAFVTPGTHTCDNEITVANTTPTVSALGAVSFPISTPFVLTGSASDPDGQAITYCWEHYDAGQVTTPSSSNTSGPLFRSISPVSVNYRYFPEFTDVYNGTTDTWELLPSVARTLTFRLTARDNFVSGGCTNEQDLTVNIVNVGPFQVTAPNGGASILGNNFYTVTWNVAGTTGNGINAANVDILYSTNPSNSSSYVALATNTPNDGSESVVMPNITSSTFRVMVRQSNTSGIYFYDISNSNNSITFSLPVELTSFSVEKTDRAARLHWTTAGEVNHRGFGVQRSVNDTRHFVEIGWVNATTNPQLENHYQFTDPHIRPGDTYYYRLAQTDHDGQVQFSNVQSVAWEGVSSTLLVAPNPAADYVQLTAEGAALEDEFEVSVFDAKGQLVTQRTMTLNNALSTSNWPAGVYYLRAVSAQKIWTGVVVK